MNVLWGTFHYFYSFTVYTGKWKDRRSHPGQNILLLLQLCLGKTGHPPCFEFFYLSWVDFLDFIDVINFATWLLPTTYSFFYLEIIVISCYFINGKRNLQQSASDVVFIRAKKGGFQPLQFLYWFRKEFKLSSSSSVVLPKITVIRFPTSVVFLFYSVGLILKFDHSNETYWAVYTPLHYCSILEFAVEIRK